jgi:hypothetical protein
MGWLSRKLPALIAMVGFVAITVMIWSEISVRDIGSSTTDEDVFGMAFAMLITFWWGYFLAVAAVTWVVAGWLKSRSVWLLVAAPAFALWFVAKITKVASLDLANGNLATSFFVFTLVAALPILLGANSHIASRTLNFHKIWNPKD